MYGQDYDKNNKDVKTMSYFGSKVSRYLDLSFIDSLSLRLIHALEHSLLVHGWELLLLLFSSLFSSSDSSCSIQCRLSIDTMIPSRSKYSSMLENREHPPSHSFVFNLIIPNVVTLIWLVITVSYDLCTVRTLLYRTRLIKIYKIITIV